VGVANGRHRFSRFVGVKVGVAIFLGQSIGIDENITFQLKFVQSISIDENNTFQLKFLF